MKQQIIAVGGGGFSTESEPGIDEYILKQAAVDQPNIGFIGTASGDAAGYILRFYTRFAQLDCKPSHLDLFRRTPPISDWVNDQDVIFVGGGNTKSMLAVWETWNMRVHLRSALEDGVVLAGISAGAICWFDSGVTDSISGELTALKCLGFLKGSCCPHYSLEADRKPTYQRMIKDGAIESGCAIDDGACVHFVDGIAHRVVSGTDTATAFSVSSKNGVLVEKPISNVEVLSV
jgi:peptidase E